VELMNTIWADRDGQYDSLLRARDAGLWLTSVRDRRETGGRHVPSRITSKTQGELVELRDALRTLAAEVTRDPRDAVDPRRRTDAVAVLNRLCASAPVWSQLDWPRDGAPSRAVRSFGSSAQGVLAELAEQGVQLFSGPSATELRACLAPGCVLYFVKDHPRREWCSAACGNRARV